MGVSWTRLGLLVLVLAVALPAATVFAQKGGEEGPINEKETTCWTCHASWAPPLKSFYEVIPPPEAGAPPGEPFKFIGQVQGAWVPNKDGPYILYYEPTLDLTNAPSLSFFSDTPDLHIALAGTATGDPTNPTLERTGFVVQEVPLGATDLTIVLAPDDITTTTGPRMTMRVYPGQTAPIGTPAFTLQAADRGGSVVLELHGKEAFQGVGYGNWTIQASYTPLSLSSTDPADLLGVPALQDQSFTVTVDASVKETGDRVQSQPIRAKIAKGSSGLYTFNLRAIGPPAPGETVHLTVNATEWYKHESTASSQFDYANVTKAFSAEIPVTFEEPRIVLKTDPRTTVGGPAISNGPTIVNMSEAVGYGSAFLLVASVWTGGMFGKASRRSLNTVFGSAKRRVAFHNFLSYGLMLFAAIHTVIFAIPFFEEQFYWTLGVLWGGLAILSMTGLGLTGALQVQMVRKWNYGTWRWSHYGLAVAAIVFTVVHMLLDGQHFTAAQEFLHWPGDPLDPRSVR